MDDLQQLPANLPAPVDDGAADHPPGRHLPRISLASTGGGRVGLSSLPGHCYPMTGRPDRDLPPN